MSSFASVKGPSTMVRLPPENLMRVPLELGWRPARSSSTPAFMSSSLYLPIADRRASLGITPASDSLLAFTIIMNFMVVLSFVFFLRQTSNWEVGRSLYFAVRDCASRNDVTVDANSGDEKIL